MNSDNHKPWGGRFVWAVVILGALLGVANRIGLVSL